MARTGDEVIGIMWKTDLGTLPSALSETGSHWRDVSGVMSLACLAVGVENRLEGSRQGKRPGDQRDAILA